MLNSSVTRRNFLGSTAAIGLASAFPQRAFAANQELVFATWGGSWADAMRDAWFDPFEEATGIAIRTVSGNDYGRIEAMVQAGRTEWDLVEVLPDFYPLARDNQLLEPVDYDVVDRSGLLRDDLANELLIPQVLFSYVLAYNKDQGSVPSTWAEVWDVEAYPGMRAFQAEANAGVLEAALLADGVPAENLYPLDVDRALDKMEEIRSNLLFYETNAQGEQYMSSGQAALGLIPDGRALNIMNAGAPVDIQYELSFLTWSAMGVLKGAPNKEAAMKFLAYSLTPEAQAAIAMAYTYGPVVPAAFDDIPEERSNILSGGPQMEGNAVLMDALWWGDNYEQASEKLTTWMLG